MAARRTVSWLSAAQADVARIQKDDAAIAKKALQVAKDLEAGSVTGVKLRDAPRTGDLSDCCKIYFGSGSPPSHRFVYREVSTAEGLTLEVVEVVAVEARQESYVYLLASSRLKRLPEETKKAFSAVHQRVIARRFGK